MFSKEEVRKNLLGSMEVALFMPVARKRFGNDYNEAVRSFIIPILLFPLTLLGVYLYPKPELVNDSANTIALLYSLRVALGWFLFLGSVYMIAREIDRKKHFFQFVIATNWLTIPATVIFAPVAWMLLTEHATWNEIYPFMSCLIFYTYAFTAFMTAHVLRVPWELAGFIVMIGMYVNNSTLDFVQLVGAVL